MRRDIDSHAKTIVTHSKRAHIPEMEDREIRCIKMLSSSPYQCIDR